MSSGELKGRFAVPRDGGTGDGAGGPPTGAEGASPEPPAGTRLEDLGSRDLAARIYEIGLLASQTGDLDAVLEAVVRRILVETGASMAGIALVDESRGELVHGWGALADGSSIVVPTRQALGQGVVGYVAKSGEPLALDDVRTFPDYLEVVPDMRSEAAVPLKLGGRVLAVLDVESREPAHFTPTELAVLSAIATPVALAIRNAQLFQEERRRANQLALLNRVSRILTSTTDLDDLLRRSVDAIREQLGYDMVALGLLEEERQRVVLRAVSSRVPLAIPPEHAQPIGKGITGEVVRTGLALLVPDVRAWENYVPAAPHIQCEMCVPLRAAGRVFGFLDAESTEAGKFDEHDRLMLETLADHVSQALENARNLRRVEQLREDLTGMLVHDLRTPLTVVRSSVDLIGLQMRRSPPGAEAIATAGRPPQLERYLTQAQSGCEEMLLLIGGLLDLQKLEAGELRPRMERCVPCDLLRSVAERLSVVADARQIAFGTRVSDDVLAAELDPDLVTRVLENLVANALKFTPPGGRVDLELDAAVPEQVERCSAACRTALVFTVRDTGPGIPLEERERIFEKFAVIESRKAGRKHSTGLGLAFCRAAVRAHGGAVWVEGEPGAGSVFRVVLPFESTSRIPAPA